MSTPKKKSTSTGGEARIERAVNQLGNAERLLLGLPKRYWKEKRETIKYITSELEKIQTMIERELANPT